MKLISVFYPAILAAIAISGLTSAYGMGENPTAPQAQENKPSENKQGEDLLEEIAAARAFLSEAEALQHLQSSAPADPEAITKAQQQLQRARLQLTRTLATTAARELTEKLKESGEKGRQALEKSMKEGSGALQEMLKQLDTVIPGLDKELQKEFFQPKEEKPAEDGPEGIRL